MILDTEDELNFIKQAMTFFYANYHGKYILGGSTNAEVNAGPFNYSQYIADDKNCSLLGTYLVYFITHCIADYCEKNIEFYTSTSVIKHYLK